MNELSIRQKIYQIRGQRVMLDRDQIALQSQYATLEMSEDQKTENEPTHSRSQIATLNGLQSRHNL